VSGSIVQVLRINSNTIVKYSWKYEYDWFRKMWVITMIKELFTICCTSLTKYNNNFSGYTDKLKISKQAHMYKEHRT